MRRKFNALRAVRGARRRGRLGTLIRDAARRELLFDLDTARRALFAREGKTAEYDPVAKTTANLMRMWVED